MPEANAFLKKVHIKNFLSFTDVEFPLKSLTVLVGPNACGKSNVLEVLHLLNWIIVEGILPPIVEVRDSLSESQTEHITFQFQAVVDKIEAVYNLTLKTEADSALIDHDLSINNQKTISIRIVDEGLLVNDVKVISIQDGQHLLKDEDGENATKYKSNKLALSSAGDYGNKPITYALAEFIKGWEFHDFRPKLDRFQGFHAAPERNPVSRLSKLLSHWHDNDRDRFNSVSESLEASTNFKIEKHSIDGVPQLALEGHRSGASFETASDGTLRLIEYYTLLNRPEFPPLIAIEEPERNLHPGALTEIAKVLEKLTEQSQVIITTHSSQLLDAFNTENLSESLGVLLLRNRPGNGTEVINIEDIRENRASLDGWITDFGIGSAIFESELLQDLME